jgi:hypothetical protein
VAKVETPVNQEKATVNALIESCIKTHITAEERMENTTFWSPFEKVQTPKRKNQRFENVWSWGNDKTNANRS